jgi:hypothetical protein
MCWFACPTTRKRPIVKLSLWRFWRAQLEGWCVPQRRTARLARVMAFLYGVLGVDLVIPIRTHAVVVDIPANGSPTINSVTPMIISVAVLLAIILAPPFLIRRVAAACADKGRAARVPPAGGCTDAE